MNLFAMVSNVSGKRVSGAPLWAWLNIFIN